MFHFEQPPPRPYYQNRYASNIAELMARAHQIDADQALRSGAIDAQTGQQIGGAVESFLKFQQDAPLRRLRTAEADEAEAKTAAIRRTQAEDGAIRQAMSDNGGDVDSALEQLRSSGDIGVTAATRLHKDVRDARMSDLEAQDKQLRVTQTRLGQAGQFLRGVQELDEDQRPDAYREVLPQVRAVLGDQLGNKLPDEYDPKFVGQALTWGETTAESVQRRRAALDTAREGVLNAKDARERDESATRTLGQWLPTVQSQEEWDAALKSAKQFGAPDITLQKFGPTYSPEAAQRAAQFGMTPAERAAARRLDNTPTRTREVTTKNPDGSETIQIVEDKPGQTFNSAPPPVRQPEITPATRATAERWKANELQKLEQQFSARQNPTSVQGAELGAMSVDDLNKMKWQIDNGYRAQIGLQPRDYSLWRAAQGGPPPSAGAPPPSSAPPVAAPVAAPATPPRVTVGQIVSIKGKRIRITQVYPDGRFDGTEVK